MYRFEKINEDEYKLISNDKEYIFKRTVDLAIDLQSIDMLASVKVADILASRGETYENTKLKVERKEGNKVIIDESNLRRIEDVARKQASVEVMGKIIEKTFNKNITDLILDLGLQTEDDGKKFINDLMNVFLRGIPDNTPIEQNQN